MRLSQILQNLSDFENDDDRFRYLYEIGLMLGPMPKEIYSEQNKVHGCSSQVWLQTLAREDDEGVPILSFRGDSDSHIVRGLLIILLEVFSNRRASEIPKVDPMPIFKAVGLADQINSQRANGMRAIISRIQKDARDILQKP